MVLSKKEVWLKNNPGFMVRGNPEPVGALC